MDCAFLPVLRCCFGLLYLSPGCLLFKSCLCVDVALTHFVVAVGVVAVGVVAVAVVVVVVVIVVVVVSVVGTLLSSRLMQVFRQVNSDLPRGGCGLSAEQ